MLRCARPLPRGGVNLRTPGLPVSGKSLLRPIMPGKRTSSAFALCALLALAACSGGSSHEPPPKAGAGDADLDKLRSLPYIAFSEEKAPEGSGGLVSIDEARSYPGYNIYVIQYECTAEMLDRHGRVLRSWKHDPCEIWESFELMDDGDLLVTGMTDVDHDRFGEEHLESRYLLRLDWDGNVVWKSSVHAHHDVEVTPRGQILTLTMDYRRERKFHAGMDVRDNMLTVLEEDGTLAGSLSLFDMLTAPGVDFDLLKTGMKTEDMHREFDMLHCNSIEWMRRPDLAAKDPIYSLGNILFASRNQDIVGIVDWDAQRLVWHWGRGEILGPHDATVLDDGNILIFDNGLGRGWSRSIELNPLTGQIEWEYHAPNPTDFYTASRGGNQRLPNGNTLITNSNSGQAFEVTRDGDIVWEFLTPHTDDKGHRATIFRMKRYEPAFIDRIRRDHGEGQQPPPTSTSPK